VSRANGPTQEATAVTTVNTASAPPSPAAEPTGPTRPRDKKMVNIRLSEALWNRAKASAGERGMTLERWVTDALEAHICGSAKVAGGPVAGVTSAPVGDDGLAWRVAALEAAVDYLAQATGVGFPIDAPVDGAAPGTTPAVAPHTPHDATERD
jgi:hypothetical protein